MVCRNDCHIIRPAVYLVACFVEHVFKQNICIHIVWFCLVYFVRWLSEAMTEDLHLCVPEFKSSGTDEKSLPNSTGHMQKLSLSLEYLIHSENPHVLVSMLKQNLILLQKFQVADQSSELYG